MLGGPAAAHRTLGDRRGEIGVDTTMRGRATGNKAQGVGRMFWFMWK
jgi:hypothetical protein